MDRTNFDPELIERLSDIVVEATLARILAEEEQPPERGEQEAPAADE